MSLSIDPAVQDLFKNTCENEGVDRNRAAEEAFRIYAEKHNPKAIIEIERRKIQESEERIRLLEPIVAKNDADKISEQSKFLVEMFQNNGYFDQESDKLVTRDWLGFLCNRMNDEYGLSKKAGLELIRTIVSHNIVSKAQRKKFFDVLNKIK
jgi:hypothetical protein